MADRAAATAQAFTPKQRKILMGIAAAVTATETCTILLPKWETMSLVATDNGIDVESEKTRAVLDADSEVVLESFREKRVGAVCDDAILQYGPGGTVFPDFLQPKA